MGQTVGRSGDLRVDLTVGRSGDLRADQTEGRLEERMGGRLGGPKVDGMVGWPRLEALRVRFVAQVPQRFRALKPA